MPGKGAQIDIWAIQGKTLHIFELKKPDNNEVGIISELMFYTNIMHDLISGKIGFAKGAENSSYRSFDKLYQKITQKGLDSVKGHFLTVKDRLHPLITHEVLDLMNQNQSKIIFDWKEYPDNLYQKALGN